MAAQHHGWVIDPLKMYGYCSASGEDGTPKHGDHGPSRIQECGVRVRCRRCNEEACELIGERPRTVGEFEASFSVASQHAVNCFLCNAQHPATFVLKCNGCRALSSNGDVARFPQLVAKDTLPEELRTCPILYFEPEEPYMYLSLIHI